jgi:predicted transposase YbfD/YdcC
VDGKSNESVMIPSRLDKLRRKGSLVTIDAAGCPRPIAERIVEAEADYLLTVKANQPKLLAGIRPRSSRPHRRRCSAASVPRRRTDVSSIAAAQ